MRVHPGGDSRQTSRDTRGDGGVRGGEGKENLNIISLEMVCDERAQGAGIEREQERTQD
ncbi:UNVERIFIED_CONTAM: hypothetical protein FKN15_014007 [Acipenser sinensis]